MPQNHSFLNCFLTCCFPFLHVFLQKTFLWTRAFSVLCHRPCLRAEVEIQLHMAGVRGGDNYNASITTLQKRPLLMCLSVWVWGRAGGHRLSWPGWESRSKKLTKKSFLLVLLKDHSVLQNAQCCALCSTLSRLVLLAPNYKVWLFMQAVKIFSQTGPSPGTFSV